MIDESFSTIIAVRVLFVAAMLLFSSTRRSTMSCERTVISIPLSSIYSIMVARASAAASMSLSITDSMSSS